MAERYVTSNCTSCGEDFSYLKPAGPGRFRKHCSDECKKEWGQDGPYIRKCVTCGESFKGDSRRKYCSVICRNRAQSFHPGRRQCAICKSEIHHTEHARKKYCSDECASEAARLSAKRNPTRTCAECGVSYVYSREGGSRYSLCSEDCKIARKRRKDREHRRRHGNGKDRFVGKSKCMTCGSEFQYRARDKGKYCSRRCWQQSDEHRISSRTRAETRARMALDKKLKESQGAFSVVNDRKCLTCGDLFTSSRTRHSFYCSGHCHHQDKESAIKRSLMSRSGLFSHGLKVCPESGYIFHPSRTNQVYATREILKVVGRRISKAKRRAITRGAEADSIDPIAVFEAQDWQCQICGCDTDPSLRGTWEPKAPELDHIIPLAKGGTHTLDNVQCACRECNAEKGDSIGDGYRQPEQRVRGEARSP